MGNEMCRVNQYHDEKYQPHVALVIVGSVTMGGISFTVSVVGGPRGRDGVIFNLKRNEKYISIVIVKHRWRLC